MSFKKLPGCDLIYPRRLSSLTWHLPSHVLTTIHLGSRCEHIDLSNVKMAAKDFHHPFQPYDIQQQFMQAVYDCIEDGKVGIFESPTGTGKSLSLICGSLTWLREHKRRNFDESMQSIEIDGDDDEPDWIAEHARTARRKEILHMRAEFEERLARIREKEKKTREAKPSAVPFHKRQKQVVQDSNDQVADDNHFALDDYQSDEESGRSGIGASQYSAETIKLLEKLGMMPKKAGREDDEMEEELKIFFCSRTHSQLSQFVGELQRARLPPGLPPEDVNQDGTALLAEQVKQITLGSRRNLCINPKVAKLNNQAAINERCLELQQSSTPSDHKCPYLPKKENEDLVLDFRDHALASIRDIEDLADVGKKLGVCPYYASRSAVTPAEMVTLPYPLLLQKTAREALGLSVKGHVVIIDEAHNLMDAIEGICSAEVSGKQLTLARESLMIYLQRFRNKLKGGNRVYVTQVVRVIDSLLASIAPLETIKAEGGTMPVGSLLAGKGVDQINLTKLVRYISDSKLARKVEGYVARIKQAETTKGGPVSTKAAPDTSTLTQIQSFLITLMNPSQEGRFFWSREGESIVLRYMLLDPSQHFRDIVEDARAVILAGGTMSPMEDYQQQLFPYLTSISTLSCGHIIPTSNLLVRAVSGDEQGPLEFSFKTRGSVAHMKRLGEALAQIVPKIAGGTVVFFASYSYLEQVRKQWHADGTEARMLATKPVFYDSRSDPAEKTFQSYSDAIASNPSRGALLFSVIGGKLSEGINFSDALGRCVIVVGMPYPNLETPEWKAKMQYLNSRAVARGEPEGKAGREHAENVCMRAVNQAIGRAIRHKNDWASILLLDARYAQARVQVKLPAWIKASMPSGGADGRVRVNEVVEDVSGFFASKT